MKTMYINSTATKTISILLAFLILLTLSVGLLPHAVAEEENVNVRFEIDVNDNLFLAKYGVMVFLDGKPIEFLHQGDAVVFYADINSNANHVLKFRAGISGVQACIWNVGTLENGSCVFGMIQTHGGSLELAVHKITDGNGQEKDAVFFSSPVQTEGVCTVTSVYTFRAN